MSSVVLCVCILGITVRNGGFRAQTSTQIGLRCVYILSSTARETDTRFQNKSNLKANVSLTLTNTLSII